MEKYDVLIIGGGVVGSAIARELARKRLTIGVLEKNLDVVCETSGRNSGVVHGGFAYDSGTLKAALCVEGNRQMDRLAQELGFDFQRCGKVLVGQDEADLEQLKRTLKQGLANGATGLRLIDQEELHRLVPAAVGKYAMFSETSGILDPFGYTVALAENAAENGVRYHFDRQVTAIRREEGRYILVTPAEEYSARWVVNAAGLGCGSISEMLGIKGYRVIGSKGDYIILDRRTGALLPMPVYPVPSNTYMGIHVTNTTDGNVIVGPNAETVTDFGDYSVSNQSIDGLAESASRIWPHIRRADYIRNYSGILPKWVDDQGAIQDFRIEIRPELAPNAVNLVGIESPGLTAAAPIARYVIGLMQQYETFEENPDFQPVRRHRVTRFEALSDEQRARLIAEDPEWGEVVCRCETVTKAEIRQAIRNPLGVHTLTGVKYRTRAMMGRCQGGYCQMRIASMIEESYPNEPNVIYQRSHSGLFSGMVRG